MEIESCWPGGGPATPRLQNVRRTSLDPVYVKTNSDRPSARLLALGILIALAATACSSMRRSSTDPEVIREALEFVGPPNPESAYGPVAEMRREVVVVIGPGMASALAGAGVIRALQDEGISIAAAAGAEFGAFIAAAYGATSSTNQMDWSILQFRKEWVAPRAGISRMITGSLRDSGDLLSGLEKIFRGRGLESSRIPTLAFRLLPGGSAESWSEGEIHGVLCRLIAGAEWMRPCPGEPRSGSVGRIRDQWERTGVRAPVVWVAPSPVTGERPAGPSAAVESAIRAFHQKIREEVHPGDLVISPAAAAGDLLDFGRRSELVYAGRRAARAALDSWQREMGWEPGRKSP